MLGTTFLVLLFVMQCFPKIMYTLYKAEIYIFSIAKVVLHIKGQIPKLLLMVSRSLLHE